MVMLPPPKVAIGAIHFVKYSLLKRRLQNPQLA